MKKHEYINVLNDHLPIDLIDKIIDYTYTYKFTNEDELKKAIRDYPDNLNTYGDCKYWDVSTITDMSWMFSKSEFNGDISNWDVSSVTNMKGMLSNSQFNRDISNWNMRNVKYKNNMFR